MNFTQILLTFCLFFSATTYAQNTNPIRISGSCEFPEYPSASKRLEEEGVVRLKLLVSVDGNVTESIVEKSSGFNRLDEAARVAMSKCKFRPAQKDGEPQQKWTNVTYTFALDPFRPCSGEDLLKWDQCHGSLQTQSGGMSVVYYVKGKQNGAGIEYDSKGNIVRSGIFNDGNLVEKRSLDPKRYPFNIKKITNPTLGGTLHNNLEKVPDSWKVYENFDVGTKDAKKLSAESFLSC
jgi:TonB family protein